MVSQFTGDDSSENLVLNHRMENQNFGNNLKNFVLNSAGMELINQGIHGQMVLKT